MKLTFLQNLVVLYWIYFDIFKYEQYLYWLNIGLQPKYAYEKVHRI